MFRNDGLIVIAGIIIIATAFAVNVFVRVIKSFSFANCFVVRSLDIPTSQYFELELDATSTASYVHKLFAFRFFLDVGAADGRRHRCTKEIPVQSSHTHYLLCLHQRRYSIRCYLLSFGWHVFRYS